MHDQTLERLIPYLVASVTSVGIEDEETFYANLERLSQELDATFESLETKEVVTHIVEIIRDLAWAVDEATGSETHSRWLIEHGNSRTWSVEDTLSGI